MSRSQWPVRVRTREEIAAECYSQIDQFRGAIRSYESFARHHDLVDSARVEAYIAKVAELVRKVEAGQFDAVRSECAVEIEKARYDTDAIERRVLDQAAAKVNRRRRVRLMATTLVRYLESTREPVPSDLRAVSTGAIGSDDSDLNAAEAAISRAFAAQVDASSTKHQTTEAHGEVAAALTDGKIETLASWAARKSASADREPRVRLERLIAEVEAFDISDSLSFVARAKELLLIANDSSTRTRIDSLFLDWARRRRFLKVISEQRAEAERRRLELARAPPDASRLIERLETVADDHLEGAIAEAKLHLQEVAARSMALHRRRAILRGLAALGYEVGADLSTALAERGRVVVKKPNHSGYGVEVMAPADAKHMQLKVVAMVSSDRRRDPTRDRDAETMWCAEFGKMRQLLASDGTDVAIERALGIGAVPLTEVDDTEDRFEVGTGKKDASRK